SLDSAKNLVIAFSRLINKTEKHEMPKDEINDYENGKEEEEGKYDHGNNN
ncbi:hypothetical protein EZS27_024653, partial [termite gut metagenome]